MYFLKKTKAGALQYVLTISVIIVLVIFAFISLVFLQQKLQIKNSFYKQAILNVQNGFNYLSQVQLEYNNVTDLQLSNNTQEKTSILKHHWGVYDIATVTSTVKNEQFSKTALLGQNSIKRNALYLKENNTPLIVVGNSKIIGDVSLPKQGIKSGNIAGTSFNGGQLFYGNRKTSSSSLPKLTNLNSLENFLNLNFINDSTTFFELSDGLEKRQSFNQESLVFSSIGHLTIANMKLQGNIILHSTSKITIMSSAKLEDIIIVAPEVDIKGKVKGNFQVISSKKISVGKNCKLNYPSALVILSKQSLKNNANKNENFIAIGENSTLKGIVLFNSENKKSTVNFNPQIKLLKESIVTGEVYCNENLELLGSVYGSVYTNNFLTKQFGSTYINHIYNGVINASKLSKQYCGLSLSNSNLKVAKWVY